MSVIVGDRCKPKYFGARQFAIRLGMKREVQFDWQASDADHYSACLSTGLFHVQNSGHIEWVAITGNKATLFPPIQDVYPSTYYISLHYGGETILLELSVFNVYLMPSPTVPIQKIDAAEALTVNGADYRGFQDQTVSRRLCKSWPSNYIAFYQNSGIGNHNYCRNPDGTSTIWCFTTDPDREWETCTPLKIIVPGSNINPLIPLITSIFADVEEGWISSSSIFKFSDTVFYTNLEIDFGELTHDTRKSGDCAANCVHKYKLKSRYLMNHYSSDYSLVGEKVIVT